MLPPRESFNNLVSLLSLYGTCWPWFFSDNILMQLPRAKRLLFIFAPSYNRPRPETWLESFVFCAARSDPAKSTIYNLALYWPVVTLNINIAWDLEEVLFAVVAATVLLELP